MKPKVLVAMSGGVDSSVAALLLKDRGYEVIGATMCFNISSSARRRPSCCGLEGIEDARRVAHQLDIPHYVLNFGRALERFVIADFFREYAAGQTPNPCVVCNQHLKFGLLLRKAAQLGIPYLATGHFARVEKSGRVCQLTKGADSQKDQSYFLCMTPRTILPRILFPVGDMTKAEVRKVARDKGLFVAEKMASQEICFIPEDYRAFLRARMNDTFFKPGVIVDNKGQVLGAHEGISNFTIGQRGGMGIAARHALYVTGIDVRKNLVIVGRREEAYSSGLIAREVNLLSPALLKKSAVLEAKIRYNHPQVPVAVRLTKSGMEVEFRTAQFAVAPGQYVALYHKNTVVAGARIRERMLAKDQT